MKLNKEEFTIFSLALCTTHFCYVAHHITPFRCNFPIASTLQFAVLPWFGTSTSLERELFLFELSIVKVISNDRIVMKSLISFDHVYR